MRKAAKITVRTGDTLRAACRATRPEKNRRKMGLEKRKEPPGNRAALSQGE
jgi:hypothetical protein